MKTLREKYQNDPSYKALVDMMINYIVKCQFTLSEMREASILASIFYKENNIRRMIRVDNIRELEDALRTIERFNNN